jgi:acylphosphatase
LPGLRTSLTALMVAGALRAVSRVPITTVVIEKFAAVSQTQQREVHYSGDVQGVGFRYTVRSLARGFLVTGFVRNLSDGSVQLVAEGDAAEIVAFLDAIRHEMGQYIGNVQETIRPAAGSFPTFEIRH